MSTQTLEAELAGAEKAIRLLIGEQAALRSQLKRERALEQLLKRELAQHHTTTGHPAVTPPSEGIPSGDRFPDVSNWQPSVNWAVVHQDASVRVGRLAVTKITEGTGYIDRLGPLRMREMAGVGFAHRGAYHFLHPSESPAEQAAKFFGALERESVVVRPTDVVICDAEVSDGQTARTVRACVAEFAAELARHCPAKRWLYGGRPFLEEFGVTLAGYDAHWLAAYVGNPFPWMLYGRGRTVAWQYTDGVHGPAPHVCPGIGPCDLSIIL